MKTTTHVKLTEKELQILKLLAFGFSNEEIAEELDISINTVKTYIVTILKKLEAKNRTHAAFLAGTNQLINKKDF